MKIRYESNNSGGHWWLSDKNWKDLEKAGWNVSWKKSRWLGTLAKSAEKNFMSLKDAIEEFEKITEQDVTDKGCNCCGAPHTFWFGNYKCFEWKCGHKENNIEHLWDFASGENLLQYIYSDKKIPKNLREALK